jgi:hypothetical protein
MCPLSEQQLYNRVGRPMMITMAISRPQLPYGGGRHREVYTVTTPLLPAPLNSLNSQEPALTNASRYAQVRASSSTSAAIRSPSSITSWACTRNTPSSAAAPCCSAS